uniref:Uncharacterized protein n=1 Tax=Bionectria ochroleuca TaxID=29856 RepID=A0A8H7K5S7_BIOOC
MPQQRQPAQPGMAPQQQPQQSAAQHKPQCPPNIAQPQQQQQQQAGLNLQKQQAQPGMVQQPQHNQAAKAQQAQPAVLHQHGHLPQGQVGHPSGPQNQQQKAQVIPAQVGAQMKDQQPQRGWVEIRGLFRRPFTCHLYIYQTRSPQTKTTSTKGIEMGKAPQASVTAIPVRLTPLKNLFPITMVVGQTVRVTSPLQQRPPRADRIIR